MKIADPAPLDLSSYHTDKLGVSSLFTSHYAALFLPLRDRPIRLLEVGVWKGESLRLWRDYFPFGQIVGLDRRPVSLEDSTRIMCYEGEQDDTALLTRISAECSPAGWDIVIDDCSHLGSLTARTYTYLRTRLKSGGVYAIEDWGNVPTAPDPDGMITCVQAMVKDADVGGLLSRLIIVPGLVVAIRR